MRMWMIEPKLMCRQHLLGEHVESHMFVGSINKHKKLSGFVKKNCLEFKAIKSRHDALVAEMKARGYNHNSPLPEITNYNYPDAILNSKVNKEQSLKDLMQRCNKCSLDGWEKN